ncbi:NADH dehydrogenase (ubiquinone) 1 beta subcomplex 8 [Kwoniella mangroviensis CBS 10435]|uniref:NADH dehydrogenase (Ubiquinone) 1 beta subcomplex 8 n=1 Tax=Kwoniella mangroviensis CBS 10435 TaxID=1331196 RepID=A0A1B9IYR8_9TREE|nr:NADH dehydrogenase (ubiquinone) 1 beta subcomplex 8 [Kwoniella mangroviensis CBS 8507]OCF60677.1 NADH dehydrogenase (ubiquinone) 1 beta subcomplex 8 [Kwoniella mangroviensis CBS 10435]OCF64632.1 NADH dehydrogenase (ubiquinone) 1 beta subcomplex 8 [Kwoniella mangroviensis CBS 8507]OCF74574.1 NADH dehydrogenase (ubiquinone) 1 beta subcomplex 8 [Kwoniella mangroviensis CBS 8886]
MFRPALLRTALPVSKRAVNASPMIVRMASNSPITTSGTPDVAETSYIPNRLTPGEEIDPQLNGYPQLPYVSIQAREPFGWWDRQERKNFGEVMHEEEDAIGMWGPDVHKTSPQSALFQLSVAFSLIGLASYVLIKNRPERPVAQRTYPYNGLEKELGGQSYARPEEVDEE